MRSGPTLAVTPTTRPASSRTGPVTVVQLLQPGAGLLRVAREQLVEVEARADQPVGGEAGQLGPGQLEAVAAAVDAQAAVADEAVGLAGVDAHVDERLDRARGEAVAADLLARERRLLQQQHVEAGLGEGVRGGRAAGAGADDDDVGVRRPALATGSPAGLSSACENFHERRPECRAGAARRHPDGRRARTRPAQAGRTPRCSATMPPVRSRQATSAQPATARSAARSAWSGQARIDSAR